MSQAKVSFLRAIERSLTQAAENLDRNESAIYDHEAFAEEFEDFASRIHSLLFELREIRAAIGDKADELEGE